MASGVRCVMTVLQRVKHVPLVRSLDSLVILTMVPLIRPLSESILVSITFVRTKLINS